MKAKPIWINSRAQQMRCWRRSKRRFMAPGVHEGTRSWRCLAKVATPLYGYVSILKRRGKSLQSNSQRILAQRPAPIMRFWSITCFSTKAAYRGQNMPIIQELKVYAIWLVPRRQSKIFGWFLKSVMVCRSHSCSGKIWETFTIEKGSIRFCMTKRPMRYCKPTAVRTSSH